MNMFPKDVEPRIMCLYDPFKQTMRNYNHNKSVDFVAEKCSMCFGFTLFLNKCSEEQTSSTWFWTKYWYYYLPRLSNYHRKNVLSLFIQFFVFSQLQLFGQLVLSKDHLGEEFRVTYRSKKQTCRWLKTNKLLQEYLERNAKGISEVFWSLRPLQ